MPRFALRLALLLALPPLSGVLAAPVEYRVQAGDTAYAIARRAGLSVEALLAQNGLSTPDLKLGQLLLIDSPLLAPSQVPPSPATYTVVAGDTLYAIARRFGLSVEALLAQNGLTTPGVQIGQVLQLPAPLSAPTSVVAPGTPLRDVALRFLNVPYAYGGASAQGTDCSGLVMQVFGPLGVNLPRRSEEQFFSGVPVERAELREGDLVFFDTEGSGQASHVGIILSGTLFVHANTFEGRVTVNDLSEKYYAERYLGARRVLPALATGGAPQTP